MRLIIVEKLDVAMKLRPYVRECLPDKQTIYVSLFGFNSFVFSYPRGNSYGSYPFLSDPKHKLNLRSLEKNHEGFGFVFQRDDGETSKKVLSREYAKDLLDNATEIICATDSDARGAWLFSELINQCAPDRASEDFNRIEMSRGMDSESISFYLNNLESTVDKKFQDRLNAAHVKNYFDYNFNINSLSIFGNLYRSLSNRSDPVFISKYMIQLMLYIKELQILPVPQTSGIMTSWEGTGKYSLGNEQYVRGLGSAASRHLIITQLLNLKLAEKTDGAFNLTELGQRFASSLHKDCLDADLPFRLDAWMCRPMNEVSASMDSYLMRFFSKQKRFQRV